MNRLFRSCRTLLPLAPLATLALSGPACTDEDPAVPGEPLVIQPREARDAAVANVRDMLDLAWRAERFLDGAATLDDASDVLVAFSGGDDEGVDDAEPVDPDEPSTGLVLPLDEVDFDELQGSLEDDLEQYVFRDDQIESQTATSITYKLSADVVCQVFEDEVDDAEEAGDDVLADCKTVVNALEPRVVVSSVVAGDIDLRLLFSPAKKEIGVLELHADTLALSANVGPFVDAAVAAVAALDPDAAPEAIVAHGTVRAALRRLGPDALRASFDVVSAVEIEAETSDGKSSLEAGTGTVALQVDRASGTAELEVDVRDVAFTAPKDVLETEDSCYDDEGNYDETLCEELDGTIAVALERIAGIASLVDGDDRLSLEGIIAGPLSLEVDGASVLELMVSDAASPLDVTVSTAPESLDIDVAGATAGYLLSELAKASDVFGDEIADTWLGDERLGVTLAEDHTRATVSGAGVMLVDGQVALTSRARPELDLTIEEGMCVWPTPPVEPTSEDEEETIDEHPFALESGATCGG